MAYSPPYDLSLNLYVAGYQNAAAVANPITCTPSGDYYCSDDEEENSQNNDQKAQNPIILTKMPIHIYFSFCHVYLLVKRSFENNNYRK